MQTKHALLAACALTLTSCGPKFSSPDAPTTACRTIGKTQYDAAIAAGAAKAKARLTDAGGVTMTTSASVKHCSKFKGSRQTCRRPSDFVIQYSLSNDQIRFVMIPKNREYRLNINRKPLPCEVIDR